MSPVKHVTVRFVLKYHPDPNLLKEARAHGWWWDVGGSKGAQYITYEIISLCCLACNDVEAPHGVEAPHNVALLIALPHWLIRVQHILPG